MKRWHVFRIGETSVYLHPAVLLMAAYAALTGHGILWMTAFLSIVVHEFAHALAASAFRCPPSAIEITPIGAVMLLEDEMKLPALKHALMLLAGPAASMVLAVLSLSSAYAGRQEGILVFLSNISIVLINLLPVLPLDGGRVMLLVLGRLLPQRAAKKFMRVLGYFAGAGLIILNIAVSLRNGGWNLSLAFAGCSILYGTAVAMTASGYRELEMLLDRKIALESRGYLTCKVFSVLANVPLRKMLHVLPARRQAVYVIFEPGTMKMLGVLSENELIQCYLSDPCTSMLEALACQKTQKNTPSMTQSEKVHAQNALTSTLRS